MGDEFQPMDALDATSPNKPTELAYFPSYTLVDPVDLVHDDDLDRAQPSYKGPVV